MQLAKLEKSWIEWIQHNINRGCDQLEIVRILNQNGFNIKNPQELSVLFDNQPKNLNNSVLQKINNDYLEIYTIENFLSNTECDQVMEIMQHKLTKSQLSGPEPDPEFRTSQTSYLSFLNNEFIQAIDLKIANTLGIDPRFSEGIQAQLYNINQQFKPHTDYFTPNTEAYNIHCKELGNRTWTFMIYLNDVEAGGETCFPKINYTFTPKRGLAVIWNNLDSAGNGNSYALHAGLPVKSGFKAIITKWFRQYPHTYF